MPATDVLKLILSLGSEPTRQLLELFGVATFVVELDAAGEARYVAANNRAELMFGVRHEDAVGRTPHDIFPADEADAFLDHYRTGLSRAEGFQFERQSSAFGATLWYRIGIIPLRRPGGGGRIILTAYDITDEKNAQAALAESESNLRRAQRLGRMGHWHHDFAGGVLSYSEAEYQLHGLDPAERALVAEAVGERMRPDEIARFLAVRQQALEAGRGYTFETELRRPDGTIQWLHYEAEPDCDTEGRLIGYFGVSQDITERKQIEQALALSESQLRRAQEMGRMGHWYVDMRSRTLTWSQALYALHQVDQDFKLSEDNVRRLFPRADWQRLQVMMAEAMTSRTGYTFEAEITLPTGHIQTVLLRAEPDTDDAGAVIGFFGVTQDITEFRQAERGLKRALRIGRMGRWYSDLRAGVMTWSDELYALTGYDPASLTPSVAWVESLLPPERRDQVQAARAAAIRDGAGFSYEVDHVRPDGVSQALHVIAEPETDAQGKVIGFFGITQDITERKRMASELALLAERNRVIVRTLDRAGVGVGLVGLDLRVLYVNTTLTAIGGLDNPEQVVGRFLREFYGGDCAYVEDLSRRLSAVVETQQPLDLDDLVWPRMDGDVRHLLVRAVPLESVGVLIVVVDRTEQHAMRELQAQIERNLQHTQKMEALGQLAGGVAHEVNNLLQPILTFARHAQGEIPSEKRNQYLGRIMDAALRMREIVANTLAFARPKVDRPDIRDIKTLLDQVLSLAAGVVSGAIEVACPPDVGSLNVRLIGAEFTQVVLNLLVNAADATDRKGHIRILVDKVENPEGLTRPQVSPGGYIRLTVADDGVGMALETQQRLFEPFFSTKPPGQGTGLGMAVVYGIVSRWGGGIAVRSAPGEGAQISIYIPEYRPPGDTGG